MKTYPFTQPTAYESCPNRQAYTPEKPSDSHPKRTVLPQKGLLTMRTRYRSP
ncbi:hypothetical protein [Sphingobacterium paucimobilis]|uniref:hypothetical protein n=1 Tax=Sphingobacterium paucimobilis TaxID=1385985 RepID=UPI0004219E0C|nr:hypothetical protein [Sphingobacterium paucimobilis]